MFRKEEWKGDVRGGQQERRKVVEDAMIGMREERKDGEEVGQGNWGDEVDGEGEKEERQEGVKGNEVQKIEKDGTMDQVQKVEKDGIGEKVEKAEQSEQVEEGSENSMASLSRWMEPGQARWKWR